MGSITHYGVRLAGLVSLIVASVALAGVNSSIRVDAGARSDGDSTVNGSITVGDNAIIDGSMETVNGKVRIGDGVTLDGAGTVNGSIRLGTGVTIGEVESVNGGIDIGENAAVSGDVSAVNGAIDVGAGSNIGGDVSNVNGRFELNGTTVAGNLSTVSGDVWLMQGSTVQGDLLIEKPGGFRLFRSRKVPRIVIGPGSRVFGSIIAEREIELYVSDTATIAAVEGELGLDDAVRFSGERPDL